MMKRRSFSALGERQAYGSRSRRGSESGGRERMLGGMRAGQGKGPRGEQSVAWEGGGGGRCWPAAALRDVRETCRFLLRTVPRL